MIQPLLVGAYRDGWRSNTVPEIAFNDGQTMLAGQYEILRTINDKFGLTASQYDITWGRYVNDEMDERGGSAVLTFGGSSSGYYRFYEDLDYSGLSEDHAIMYDWFLSLSAALGLRVCYRSWLTLLLIGHQPFQISIFLMPVKGNMINQD